MARLEALLAPVADGQPLRATLLRLAQEMAGTCVWLDGRDALISLTVGQGALAVQVLLELRYGSELGVLVRSREGMGNGAPLSTPVLERLLDGVQVAVPAAVVRFRSDRDGPIRQVAVTGPAGGDRECLRTGRE